MTTNWRCSHGWQQGNQCPDCEKIASMQAEIDELRGKLKESDSLAVKVHESWLRAMNRVGELEVERAHLHESLGVEPPDRYDLTRVYTPNCNRHPDAPHGVDEVASYYAGHPVCTCRSWKPGEAS